jgi:hypothetical protein
LLNRVQTLAQVFLPNKIRGHRLLTVPTGFTVAAGSIIEASGEVGGIARAQGYLADQ